MIASIDILDTGFLDVNTRNGQLASGYRANSGSALTLKGVNIDLGFSSNLDKASAPGYVASDIKHHEKRAWISNNPTTVTITIILNSRNINTNNVYGINDMSLLAGLSALASSVGVKVMYYPVSGSATDGVGTTTLRRNEQAVYQLGLSDTSENQGDINISLWNGSSYASGFNLTNVKYIPVRFESSKILQTPDNMIKVTLSGVITG